MSFPSAVRDVASGVARGRDPREAVSSALGRAVEGSGGFGLDPGDFIAAREQTVSSGTRIEQQTTSLHNAGEVLNRSRFEDNGTVHVITPMVMPRGRTIQTMFPVLLLIALGIFLGIVSAPVEGLSRVLVGPHYWLLVLLIAAFLWWRRGMVMVPEGCQALITKFGKVEAQVGPGLVTLFNPWKRVSYIVNTTREYPFNAPIREAPTKSGVKASVDLFLQFRILDPREFIFVLGAVQGFQDKLNNAISETTRSLIYEQEASDIYDLVGESTTRLLDQLNAQFRPAVELTNANITHAEPSSQEYRMDLAAPEIVRVAKEAYTYEYELQLRKEQNEGDLNKDLASLNETLSSIQADIAQYQAQMDTALERETNRARAVARQRFVEAESSARANAALLEAQALDIRAVSAATAPEILEYRFQQNLLERLESVASRLPQIVEIGADDSTGLDFLRIAQQMIGGADATLFTPEDLAAIRGRLDDIRRRIGEREDEIGSLLDSRESSVALPKPGGDGEVPNADRVEEIRRSVAEAPDGASADGTSTAGSSGAPLGAPAEAPRTSAWGFRKTSSPQAPGTAGPTGEGQSS